MHVAVAIVGFRNPGDISRCLEALSQSSHADFEIIICENGGAAAFDALTAILPPALAGGQPVRAVLAPHNLGYAGGVNQCLEQTPAADAWWVLNPDTAPYPTALEAQVKRLQQGDCDAVGCTVHLPDRTLQSWGGQWHAWIARSVFLGARLPMDRPVDPQEVERLQNYLNGASMVISRRFLEVVGPMREDYFLYCEEVEWCLRGLHHGIRLGFAKDAMVLHYQGTTTGAVTRVGGRSRLSIHLNERNKLLLTRDCFPQRLPVAALAALAVMFLRYGRRLAWRQLGYALGGWVAGLSGERGPPAWAPV